MRRICLVGAGFIYKSTPRLCSTCPVSGVCCDRRPRTRPLPEAWPRALVSSEYFGSVQEAIEADAFDCAHV